MLCSQCPPSTMPYTVKAGDTFYGIAMQFNTTVAALMAANPSVNPNHLVVGQCICVPHHHDSRPDCPGGTYYTVRAGDTLYSIANANNVTVNELMMANPGINPYNLQVGQVICIPAPTPPPTTCPPGTTAYTVRPGDTFYSLAQRFNTTVAAIQAANPNVNPNHLQVGQILCIPGPMPPPTTCPSGTTAYTVQAGDTFYSLAQRFNTTVAAIQAANPNVNPNQLYIGQIICIPGPTPPPTTCPSGTTAYTIQAGDTFYSLAQRFNTTVAAIQAANPNVNPNQLQIGQVICIPGPTPPPTTCPSGTTAYTIQAGDTFYSLAQRFNTTVAAIQAANPNVNPNQLQIGQIICIPGPTPPPSGCPSGTTAYTIRAGDTFYSLAQRFNTTVAAIQAANPNVNPNNLQIGQVICIPGGTTPPSGCPSGTTAYTIRAGDTFYSLAQRFNTTVAAIQAANPNVNPNNLQIGQVICIPGGTTPPSGCPSGTTAYTIRAGDTFYSLAQRFNTTVAAIQAANPNVNPNNLQIGQVICIPGGTTPPSGCPSGTTAYTIRAGDTFYSLAQRFNTTVAAIQAANPNVNPNNLQIGQVICIPGGTTPPSTCPSGTRPYTVRAGDTFYSLARRFNTTVAAIQAANPNVNPNNLQVGQVICIPG